MTKSHQVKILIGEKEIKSRIDELAVQLAEDYADKELIMIGILHGGAVLLADLSRALWRAGLKKYVYKDYFGISSYGSGIASSGKVRITKRLKNKIKNKNVLIVEDIVDTGRSLQKVMFELAKKQPKSIKTLALLSKPSRREVEVKIDYIGFEIENKFVVGYDLDYNEEYRTMPYIGEVIFD